MGQGYKFTLTVLLASFSGGWIGYSLESATQGKQDNTHSSLIASSASNINNNNSALIASLQQQVQQLQKEKQALAQQVHLQSTKQLSSSSDPHQITKSSEENQHLHDKLQAMEMERQQRKANDFGDWIMESQAANTTFDLNNELLHRFEQENRDPVWAEQQENHYRQLFNNKEELRDFAFHDTQCRSTQCEITVSISNREQSHQLLQTMSSTLPGSVVVVATDEQRGLSKLYISEEAKSFEFH